MSNPHEYNNRFGPIRLFYLNTDREIAITTIFIIKTYNNVHVYTIKHVPTNCLVWDVMKFCSRSLSIKAR